MDSGLLSESSTLGRYQIVKRLGGGEASEVLLAVSHGPHGFERVVVLRRLLPKYAWDTTMERRMATEAIAYARLTHPAVVRLYDFFDLDGHPVLVLEYVEGLSLAALQASLGTRGETLSDPAVIYLASRVFAALAAAHAARNPRTGEFAPVIHRDVSPRSVLVPWDGFAKLGEFGFAKVKGLTADSSDTRRGLLKGTLGYMAPEQALGDPVSPRTDVYAACLLLRELLVGRPAFVPAMPELELLRAMAETELAPIETLRSGLSPALADAMRRGLTRDPEARTLTAAEMERVLRQETDLALAQAALVDALARVRPSESRASTPPAGSRAFGGSSPSGTMRFERLHLPPEAMPSGARGASAIDSDSHPTLRFETPNAVIMLGRPDPEATPVARPPAKKGATFVAIAGLVALAACVALGIAYRGNAGREGDVAIARSTGAVVSVATSAPSSAPLSAPSSAPTVAAPSPPLPSPPPASTVGDLVTPPHAHSHRVFVDGRYAAPCSGATITLRCGEHVVRIGSKGRDQRVEVPCGGSISVETP